MPRVCIIANESEQQKKLKAELINNRFDCYTVPNNNAAIGQITGQPFEVILLDMDETTVDSQVCEQVQQLKKENQIPLIALIPRDKLDHLDSRIDDFVVKPYEANEVKARIKRVLRPKVTTDNEDIIRCGDLVIDLTKYEVSLGSKSILLTFREYQLLKFLASNKGKVFTREDLLNKVWGWDYYGGDRTVDVHIRRLRSKIEDPTHTFIETVRNIGYRLRQNP